jgi:4-amino-4-deoxy-L-arabinose transferase-like glycosyltransferase
MPYADCTAIPDDKTKAEIDQMRAHRINSLHGKALFAVASIFLIVGARWIWVYRHGQLLDIDEAGYLGFALNDYGGFIRGGLTGWLSAIAVPSIQAPMTTVVTSLIFIFTGPKVIAGFSVPLLAGLGCVIATYFLGKSVSYPRVGLLASILVASCPVIVNFSRTFQFSMPATLMMTLGLITMIKSERFKKAGWAILFGLSLGLMPLARTMTIAFIPGMAAGAFVYTIAEPSRRLQRVLMLSSSLVIAACTTATWLVPNGKYVFEYLFNFGYGSQASEYGAEQSKFGPDAWLAMLGHLCNNEVYLPHFFVLLLGALSIFIVATLDSLKSMNGDFFYKIIQSSKLPVVIVIAEALLVLTSTRNKGTAFFAPIVPAMMVTAVWACLRVSHYRWYRFAVTGLLIGVVIVAGTPLLDLRTPISSPVYANAPILGRVLVTDGRGTLQRYLGQAVHGPDCESCSGQMSITEPMVPVSQRDWINISERTAAMIHRTSGINAVVAWGFRHHLYNVNTVNLQALLSSGSPFGGRQIEPTVTGESVDGYMSWMTQDVVDACVLLTSDKIVKGDFLPVVNRAFMHEAAEKAGLIPDQQLSTPDGQTVTIWKHKVNPPNCR